jgi:hypothetical protein
MQYAPNNRINPGHTFYGVSRFNPNKYNPSKLKHKWEKWEKDLRTMMKAAYHANGIPEDPKTPTILHLAVVANKTHQQVRYQLNVGEGEKFTLVHQGPYNGTDHWPTTKEDLRRCGIPTVEMVVVYKKTKLCTKEICRIHFKAKEPTEPFWEYPHLEGVPKTLYKLQRTKFDDMVKLRIAREREAAELAVKEEAVREAERKEAERMEKKAERKKKEAEAEADEVKAETAYQARFAAWHIKVAEDNEARIRKWSEEKKIRDEEAKRQRAQKIADDKASYEKSEVERKKKSAKRKREDEEAEAAKMIRGGRGSEGDPIRIDD